jgi:hypothetical protein
MEREDKFQPKRDLRYFGTYGTYHTMDTTRGYIHTIICSPLSLSSHKDLLNVKTIRYFGVSGMVDGER